MRYLGCVSGSGVIEPSEAESAPAKFEFECYLVKAEMVASSGELTAAPDALRRLFGRSNVPFTTKDGHQLKVTLSDTKIAPTGDSAHVVVAGELPTLRGGSLHWPAR